MDKIIIGEYLTRSVDLNRWSGNFVWKIYFMYVKSLNVGTLQNIVDEYYYLYTGFDRLRSF